jgi:hypothetical protein
MATNQQQTPDYSHALTSSQDSELWSLLTDVPRLSGLMAIVCAILNLPIAGLGTIIAGCIADKDGWNKT